MHKGKKEIRIDAKRLNELRGLTGKERREANRVEMRQIIWKETNQQLVERYQWQKVALQQYEL